MFFDPDTRKLPRTRSIPLTYDQARKLRGARPSETPHPSGEAITVQRWAATPASSWSPGQKVALCRLHARQIVTVHVADTTLTSELDGTRQTLRRTTTPPVRGPVDASQ